MASQEKKNTLKIVKNDPWLEPYKEAILGRHLYALQREAELTNGSKLTESATNHSISDCIKRHQSGCSVNGRPMLLPST